ncbi:MAG: methyltransferase domain-containing protein [Acidimicrobiales bacterium]|nr:methyltransferase domain-containing protein [Acidimicrobiales bacterium]
MSEIHESNQAQADFWSSAGTLWTALRERFDDQAGDHGIAAIDALAPAPGERILDIGCGAGSATIDLAGRVGPEGSVRGLDISPTMIDGARELAASSGVTNVSFEVADAMVAPFEGDHDGLYSRFGVMFFSDPVRGFANMRTALRPGGRIGFVCWQTPVQNEWASVPLSVIGQFAEMPFGADPTAPGPFSLSDPARLEQLLTDAGYTDVELAGREVSVKLGDSMGEAVDFLFGLMPPAAALRANDPETAEKVAAALVEAFADWEGDDGVLAPSATWIVTGRSPD